MASTKENSLFCQLKRLATTVERERVALQNDMKKTVTSHEDQSSAVLVMRDIQQDVRQMKKSTNDQLKSFKENNKSFEELLDLMEIVVKKEKEKTDEIELYLQQYGYTTYADTVAAEAEQKTKKAGLKKKTDKENNPPPALQTCQVVEDNDLLTPQKVVVSEAEPKGCRTPTLADFGLSAFTIDAMTKGSTKGQMPFPPLNNTCGTDTNYPQVNSQYLSGPMATPLRFSQSQAVCVTPGIGFAKAVDSPIVPMFETPGVKQIHKQRSASPLQRAVPSDCPTTQAVTNTHLEPSMLRSPEMPQLTGVYNFMVEPLTAQELQHATETPSVSSVNRFPQVNSQHLSGPVATPLHFSQSQAACVTPGIGFTHAVDSPMPPMFETPGVKQIRKQVTPSPSLPKPVLNLTAQTTDGSPVPPMLKTPGVKQISRVCNAEKAEVQQMSTSVRSSYGTPEAPDITIKLETLTGSNRPLQGQYSWQDCSYIAPNAAAPYLTDDQIEPAAPITSTLNLDDTRPTTPERVTNTLQDFNSPAMPQLTGVYNFMVESSTHDLDQESSIAGTVTGNITSLKRIPSISSEEYSQQGDYIQRQLSAQYISSVIDKINTFISNKCQGSSPAGITEDELKTDIGLGYKTKVMLLLLTRLQRLHCKKAHGHDQDVYYII